jgi:hypothetical protein
MCDHLDPQAVTASPTGGDTPIDATLKVEYTSSIQFVLCDETKPPSATKLGKKNDGVHVPLGAVTLEREAFVLGGEPQVVEFIDCGCSITCLVKLVGRQGRGSDEAEVWSRFWLVRARACLLVWICMFVVFCVVCVTATSVTRTSSSSPILVQQSITSSLVFVAFQQGVFKVFV